MANALAFCCVHHLGCEPTLITPVLLDRLLLDVLPAASLAPTRFGHYVPAVVEAWTQWLAERNKLPKRSRLLLMASMRRTLKQFASAWHGPDALPLRRYLENLNDEDASTGDVITKVIERRTFAVPAPDDRADGYAVAPDGSRLDVRDVDAADESDRMLITVNDLSARQVPQHRFPLYLAVVQQLWDDDPPDTWAAAKRMQAGGRTRDAILDRLARAWDTAGSDETSYAEALRRL